MEGDTHTTLTANTGADASTSPICAAEANPSENLPTNPNIACSTPKHQRTVPQIPTELWLIILKDLTFFQLCRSIAPVCKRFAAIATEIGPPKFPLTPTIWERIFVYFCHHKLSRLRLVCATFNHILQNTRNETLQYLTASAAVVAQPLSTPMRERIRIHGEYTYSSRFFPTTRLGMDFEFIEENIRDSKRKARARGHVCKPDDDITYPAIAEAVLCFHGVATRVRASRPGRGLSVRDTLEGFCEIIRGGAWWRWRSTRWTAARFLKSALCKDARPPDKDHCWDFRSRAPKGGVFVRDSGQLRYIPGGEKLVEVEKLSIADLINLPQCTWRGGAWKSLKVVVGEDGIVRLDLFGWEMHIGCQESCDWVQKTKVVGTWVKVKDSSDAESGSGEVTIKKESDPRDLEGEMVAKSVAGDVDELTPRELGEEVDVKKKKGILTRLCSSLCCF